MLACTSRRKWSRISVVVIGLALSPVPVQSVVFINANSMVLPPLSVHTVIPTTRRHDYCHADRTLKLLTGVALL